MSMPRPIRSTILAVAVALLAGGCGGGDDETSTTPSREAKPEPTPEATTTEAEPAEAPAEEHKVAAATGPTVVVRGSEFGRILFDGNRRVFYLLDADKGGRSTCYDDCAEAWPPVLTKDAAIAGSGATPRLLGTTRRKDGTTQITYGGKPMYYYAHEGPGEVKCHGVSDAWGQWLVVRPDGTPAPT